MKILLVEDNRGDALLFSRAMRRSEVEAEIVRAESAEAALDVLKTHDSLPINIVVLDINLPGMSGTQFLEVIKRDPALRRLPVVVLSSSSAPRDVDACYDRFANGYLTKPLQPKGYERLAHCLYDSWLGLMELPSPLDAPNVVRLN